MVRTYVTWLDMVPKGIAWQWAVTFGLRPTSELLRTLLVSHGLWAVVQRFGMEACPHGFCIAVATPGPRGGDGCRPAPAQAAVCSIPDSAEACSCRVEYQSGDGYCYLGGYPLEERAAAERALGKDPPVAHILRLTPEYSAGAYWEGGSRAHVSLSAPYRLVDLPGEVVVGGRMVTCRALGCGHLSSEYCQSCRTMPGGVPRFTPALTSCSTGSAGPFATVSLEAMAGLLRADKKVMSRHEGGDDALWVREEPARCPCAPELGEGTVGLVALCECSDVGGGVIPLPAGEPVSALAEGFSRVQVTSNATSVHGSPEVARWRWKRLSVSTVRQWTTLLHKGEEMHFASGGVLVAREKSVVVHVEKSGSCAVYTPRSFVAVRAHDAVSAKRVQHMRFIVGAFTHWKILEKLSPTYVWHQKGGPNPEANACVVASGLEPDGLCASYYVRGSSETRVVKASLVAARHGHGLITGASPVTVGAFSAPPSCTVWVYPGDVGHGCVLEVVGGSPDPDPGKGCLVYVMDDDYELDDGGPSSGEEGYSAGDAYV